MAMSDEYVFYDLETTSAEPDQCRIVEMCFASSKEILLHTLVDPGTVISPSAIAVHGITKEKLLGERPFLHYADIVQEIIDDRILVGFNNIHFDSVVLDRELTREGYPGLHKDGHGIIDHREIDLFGVWKNAERRDLATAVQRFAFRVHEGAHGAANDVLALPDVMKGMAEQLDLEADELFTYSKPVGAVDREGKFVTREDGVIVFGFGKHKGNPVRSDRNYLSWMLSADFSPEVKAYCRRFLNQR
jgi:DNA polymerase-3 subunit epsilon